jgi:uncharacterized protein YegP (UPF0339 family)
VKFIVYKDAKKQWRWTLRAQNGRKIANAGEGYKRRIDCLNAIALVQSTRGTTPIGWPENVRIKSV